jgi:hypothetical protein
MGILNVTPDSFYDGGRHRRSFRHFRRDRSRRNRHAKLETPKLHDGVKAKAFHPVAAYMGLSFPFLSFAF